MVVKNSAPRRTQCRHGRTHESSNPQHTPTRPRIVCIGSQGRDAESVPESDT